MDRFSLHIEPPSYCVYLTRTIIQLITIYKFLYINFVCLFFCLFFLPFCCFFMSVFYVVCLSHKSTAIVMAGRSAHLTTLFFLGKL